MELTPKMSARLHASSVPIVVLSHRKREFLETAMGSIDKNLGGVHAAVVVDDSGDRGHHRWLDDHNYAFSVVDSDENAGYLNAMNVVWKVARTLADEVGSDYVLLWEEDFLATKTIPLAEMVEIMDENPDLAQLNLQRQPVYAIEKRLGYMRSHQRRGYVVNRQRSKNGHPWISRRTPFTTNPSLIRREVLDIDWPSRIACDLVVGGAEPAMSRVLENRGWAFGWYGNADDPYTEHIGTVAKSGTGY